ncbi:MAG: GNAT family N-acetyltransferase [Alphaproteobacteria bacterium]|nr:GNAT family N-acetyltransferase [Alphaproteobacteria bacterium]
MIRIRRAETKDRALVYGLIRDLAVYEKLLDQVDATETMIGDALFGENPRAFCEIVSWNGEDAGFALWFYNFSTFRGKHGLFLEDIFVNPDYRGWGLGKALLKHLAQRCVEEGLARFEWSVLDWNEPSIAFYTAMGAEMMDGWTGCRVSGDALVRLAAAE